MGLGAGALLALSNVEVLRSLIFGVTPYDVSTIAAAVATLSATATLACVPPALRASNADPMHSQDNLTPRSRRPQ